MTSGDRGAEPAEFKRELIDAFIRLAKGDLSVRVARNYQRDHDDVLAYFVNLIAEELGRFAAGREREHASLARGVEQLSEAFIAFAAGDYAVRVPRSGTGDAIDVLGFMFNNTVAEVGDAVAEVERQREVVEATLAAMIDGVLVADATGTVTRSNPAMAALLGHEPTAIVGTALAVHLAADDGVLRARTEGAIPAESFRDRRTRFVDAKGGAIELEVNGSPLRDAAGAIVGFVLVARDDRDLRAVEAQLLMSDRLATVGTVAAGVAHEVNNPLAFIIANLEFLGEELDEIARTPNRTIEPAALAEMTKALTATLGGAHRVKQIVRDLKAFARVEHDATGEVELAALADTSIAMVRNELRHHARVVKAYGPVPRVIANEGRLVQVIVNLLQNAAHAIPAGSAEANEVRVAITTTATGEAMISVRDTGAGIPDEVRARMFDAFFTTKPPGVGTGLGLAIGHKIVSDIGGRIEVESAVGAGSTFHVILPAARAAPTIAARVTTPLPAPTRALRILAIDDEVEIGAALERTLGRDHEVTFVSSAPAALALVATGRFDVVLCDVMMPEMTGVQFLAQLAVSAPALAARLVFMTGGAFSPGSRELVQNTSHPCIDKPFDSQTLRATIARVAGLAAD